MVLEHNSFGEDNLHVQVSVLEPKFMTVLGD